MLGARSVLMAEVRAREVTLAFSYFLHACKTRKHPFVFFVSLLFFLFSSQLQWQEQVPWG